MDPSAPTSRKRGRPPNVKVPSQRPPPEPILPNTQKSPISISSIQVKPVEIVVRPNVVPILSPTTFFTATTSIVLSHSHLFGDKRSPCVFSFVFWAYPIGIRSTPFYILSKYNNNPNNYGAGKRDQTFLFRIGVDSENNLRIDLSTDLVVSASSSSSSSPPAAPLSPNKWNHVCVQFKVLPDQTCVEIFVDGASRSLNPLHDCTAALLSQRASFILGSASGVSSSLECESPLGLVASLDLIFDFPVTLAQLLSHMQTTRPTFPSFESSPPVPLSARPLYSFSQLLKWTPDKYPDPLNCAFEPLRLRAKAFQRTDKRFILCHDMQGGYIGDNLAQGSDRFHSYAFTRWSALDLFIYFSHHRITIPPANWINAAHRNGVAVLGTIITEGDVGYEENGLLLDSPPEVIAEKLVSLASYYGFDGWFFNIESKLRPDDQSANNSASKSGEAFAANAHVLSRDARKLCELLRVVTAAVHKKFPLRGKVLWYDSVTSSGALRWQNELNSLNKCYFDCCDGIFLNYNWTPEMAQLSARMAQHRLADVYVGTDVFGRGTYGGGGYNSYKGIHEAHLCGASAAIFAPGWTLECEASTGDEFLFQLAEDRLWDGRKFEAFVLEREKFKVIQNGGVGWGLSSDTVLPNSAERAAITSSDWCTRSQLIDLSLAFPSYFFSEDTESSDDRKVPELIVCEKFRGTEPNVSDLFYLKVELRDANQNVLLSFDSGIQKANEKWQTVFERFRNYSTKVRYLYWEDGGRDAEHWAGHYGTKIDMPRIYLRSPVAETTSSINAHLPIPSHLPLVSSFCTGRGHNLFLNGQICRPGDWFNLSYQDAQPSFFDERISGSGKVRCDLDYSIAFCGGSSLRFSGQCSNANFAEFRLFKWLGSSSVPVVVSIVTHQSSSSAQSCLDVVLLSSASNKRIVLRTDRQNRSAADTDNLVFAQSSTSIGDTYNHNHSAWTISHFHLDELPPVEEIRVVCFSASEQLVEEDYSVHLGQIRIVPLSLANRIPSSVNDLRASYIWNPRSVEDPESAMDVYLQWNSPVAQTTEIAYYNVYVEKEFRGRAYSHGFYLKELRRSQRFTCSVQCVSSAGVEQQLSDAASIRIE